VSVARALAAGAAGAAALTAVHQLGKANLRHPPRMDVLGRRAVTKIAKPLGLHPSRDGAQRAALAGDLISNAIYYALAVAGASRTAPWRGTSLGALAGIGALLLPGPMGLGRRPSRARSSTAALTVALYTLGGLVAGLARHRLQPRPHPAGW
jgi:hypothetical protein